MAFRNGHYAKLEKIKKQQHIKSLVKEFFDASAAANCSIIEGGGRMNVLERWFTELGVGWVLQLDDGSVAPAVTHDYAFYERSWVSGLFEITDTIHRMVASFSELKSGDDASILDAFQFAQFIQKAMLKMLASVDVIVARNAEMTIRVTNGLPPSYDKLSSLVSVHGALSKALSEIPLLFSEEVIWIVFPVINREQIEKIVGGIVTLLAAKEGKVAETVSTTIQQISSEVTRYLYADDDSSSSQGSPDDIHKATRSVMSYITFLQSNYSSMAPFVSQAVAASLIGDKSVQPLDSMTLEMTSCLEEKFVKVSESFPDQGLRFLFLLNNSYFIKESLLFFTLLQKAGNECRSPLFSSRHPRCSPLSESRSPYGEVSTGVLGTSIVMLVQTFSYTSSSLIQDEKLLCSKFVSAFQKTYTTQKLWKVPDPKLRKSLRTAIIEKIIPDYTKYIEENNIATPKFTPNEMEEMLQELFEG